MAKHSEVVRIRLRLRWLRDFVLALTYSVAMLVFVFGGFTIFLGIFGEGPFPLDWRQTIVVGFALMLGSALATFIVMTIDGRFARKP